MSYLFLLPILIPAAGGFAVWLIRSEGGRRAVTVATLLLTLGAAALLCVWQSPAVTVWDAGAFQLRFGCDGVGQLFLPLMCTVFLFAAIYSFGYLKSRPNQFLAFLLWVLSALIALALAQNLVTLYLCYEWMTVLAVPLVIHERTREAVRASVKFLGYSVFGACLALGGVFLLSRFGVGQFTPGGDALLLQMPRQGALVIYFLMMVGFGCKASLFPLHGWLPTAHPVAPAPASALLSGIITKTGVLCILRVTYYLYPLEILAGSWAQKVLLVLALLTILMGSMLALREPLLKKRLAYSTVSQASYVLLGLFLFSAQTVTGALLQLLYHAAAKTLLFLCAGSMIYRLGRMRVEDLRGLGRTMPVTFWCFAFGALSLIGIPPFGGFVSKWFLVEGILAGGIDAFSVTACAILLFSALLTAGYLLPPVIRAFFPGREVTEKGLPPDPPRVMTGPMLVLAAACLVLGLFPQPLLALLRAAAAAV